MISYKFHADSSILELTTESDRFFIDLNDTGNVLEEGDGQQAIRVYRDPDDVYYLFGCYGCARRCPYSKEDL